MRPVSLRGHCRRQNVLFSTRTHNAPNAHRVWLTLLEKGVDHALVHVDLSSKPSWYFSLNPKGLVPALEHKGEVHVESLDICQFIDSAFEGELLAPKDSNQQQHMQELINKAGDLVGSGLNYIGGSDGRWAIANVLDRSGSKNLKDALRVLASSIQSHGGPFLCGDNPALADFALFPFFWRFFVILDKLKKVPLERDASVDRWLAAMCERASAKVSNPDALLLIEAFKKHSRMDFFDYVTYTLNQLHPHLQP